MVEKIWLRRTPGQVNRVADQTRIRYFDSRQNHVYASDRNGGRPFLSILKPLAECFDFFLRVGREQMFDRHVGRRDENGFRVRESVKTGLTVVVADSRESDASERHGFNEQMNVHLVDRAAAEGQAREEMVDRLLVTAEKETGKGLWMLLHLANGRIHVFIGEDRENRSEDFVLHNRIVPS